ncbi:hypothetical protein DM02DRAFT_627189 [Periconia macrospinosa]|uniref:Uncharacterized protein n=1 Tax=Periconia macrospinosa TaxID=97972 RepID=A0A2V1DV98_9PLEO|nr:hypothetical protein DM02DRAFT_627189 [Periconia macrospinosa]
MSTSTLANISSTAALTSPNQPTKPKTHTTPPTSPTSSKPPSVLRYTLILLKARPTPSDISTISVYSTTKSAGSTPPSTPSTPYTPSTACEAASTHDQREERWLGRYATSRRELKKEVRLRLHLTNLETYPLFWEKKRKDEKVDWSGASLVIIMEATKGSVLDRAEKYIWGLMEYSVRITVCAIVLAVVFFAVLVLRPDEDGEGVGDVGAAAAAAARHGYSRRRGGAERDSGYGGSGFGFDGTTVESGKGKEEKTGNAEFEGLDMRDTCLVL